MSINFERTAGELVFTSAVLMVAFFTVSVGYGVVLARLPVTKRLERKLYEVPVGFKWFVDGLFDGSLGFGGEESASESFLRRDGAVWTADKDGIVPALLAAEITARSGRDPGELYRELI